MLTRFIRIQLVIFAIGSLVGMAVMASVYMQVPTLLGWGRITVTVELPGTGGLYRFSNVTYRGVQVGKVTDVDLIPHGASATLSLKTSPKIPAKLAAHVRSASAIGEQYLDLVPEDDDPPYLVDGSRIAMADTTVPQEVGPLLDQTSALIKSIPKERLSALLNESYLALGGAGDDLALLVDSAATISGAMSDTREQTVDLLQDSVPLLNAQEESRESLRVWSRSLADITGTMVASDGQWRTILRDGPGAANEASRLFNQLKPTLPLLLANLRTVGQILVTYRAGLEQILVLMPPFVANLLSAGPDHNPTGMGQGDFTISEGDPPSCTVGFLPPSQWRSPEDTSEVDTPTGMYCKLPQDSPLAVRGARNYPCAGKPGKRAPTAAIQRRTASATNSGPLSDLMKAGGPCRMNSWSRLAATVRADSSGHGNAISVTRLDRSRTSSMHGNTPSMRHGQCVKSVAHTDPGVVQHRRPNRGRCSSRQRACISWSRERATAGNSALSAGTPTARACVAMISRAWSSTHDSTGLGGLPRSAACSVRARHARAHEATVRGDRSRRDASRPGAGRTRHKACCRSATR